MNYCSGIQPRLIIKIDSYNCMGDRWNEDSKTDYLCEGDLINNKLASETLVSKIKKESRYVIKDIRGSLEQLTCQTGLKDKVFEYSAFGELKTDVSINDIHGFTGYVNDKETTLYYANARMYNPQMSKFMSKDILRVDSLNRYLYVVNNPVNLVDPSGMDSISLLDVYSLDTTLNKINMNYKNKLVRLGYIPMMYVMNGEIDDITKNSIIKFQQDNSLRNTGKFDIITKRKIDEMIKWQAYEEEMKKKYPAVFQNDEVNCENAEQGDITKISKAGAELLSKMEVSINSDLVVKKDNKVIGIITKNIGDGGLTVGYGYFIKFGDGFNKEVQHLKDVYDIDVVEDKMINIDKCLLLYRDTLTTYENRANDYIKSRGISLNQYEYDALVIQCYNGAHYDVMDAFRDKNLNDVQALEKALDTYRKFSTWNIFKDGWKNRLENTINLYRHGDYRKTY